MKRSASRQLATWQQTQPGLAGREWAIGYDARQQVVAITEQPLSGPLPSPQQVWRYQYDLSGNRTADQEGSQTRTATHNHLNQITGLSAGGTTWFRGKVNEPANVTLNGQNARVHADGTFEPTRGTEGRQTNSPSCLGRSPEGAVERLNQPLTELGAGVHDVFVQATDKAGNVTSETWRVDNGTASGAVPTHDLEGNLLTDGHYTYTWDARNRMTSVSVGSDTWTFQYDGQNRRISESKNGSPVRQWVWHGTEVMEERLANGTKHRFWSGGIESLDSGNQQAGKRLVLHDHLGSTRVVVDGTSGTVTASYDYSPWGQRTRISGTEDWGVGYTGHWWHESGLSLAVYRPYDPRTGRWPSRDPIGEKGGLNIYSYSKNRFINLIDSIGLAPVTFSVTSVITRSSWYPFVPSFATGVKTQHVLTVDDLSGAILFENQFTGTTFGIPASSKFTKRIKTGPCWLVVRMTGWAQNNANPFLASIDYDVTFTVHTLTGKVRLIGKHDGYPSYIMAALSGHYSFNEIDASRLNPPMEIDVDEFW